MQGGFMKYVNSCILEEGCVRYKDDLKQKYFTA